MKFKKKLVQAHRDYFLICHGDEYYDGRVYHSKAEAKRIADAMNARRNTAKYGSVTVGFKDLPASIAYEGTLRL